MMEEKSSCRRRVDCRLCGSTQLVLVFSLEPTPPANAFVPLSLRHRTQECFPLNVFLCEECAHLQLLDIVSPALLFEDYIYVSGTSPVFVRHFEEYAHALLKRFRPEPGALVIDIGSNDGTLLSFFKDAGYRILGIDPARDIAQRASERGIETLCGFFGADFAEQLRGTRGSAVLITANNVFAHIDDLAEVVRGVRRLLVPNGIFVFEVSYLLDVIENTLFDTIYHEHLDYHSVAPLVRFFASHGLEMIEAERITPHGGSLRGIVQVAGGSYSVGASVAVAIEAERLAGLDRAETFHTFARHIDALKVELGGLLRRLKSEGKRIAGFGAPAKATTLMYHFGLGPELIDFIVDDSPLKQGLFTPGLHIPVLSSAALVERQPDFLLILAWNFASSIITKNAAFHDAGGRFIVPLPHLKVI
ncbi:SAM-dependent methyltransferase [Gammaproteobacteria bacterium]